MSYEELTPDKLATEATPDTSRGRQKNNSLPIVQTVPETHTRKPHGKPRAYTRAPLQAKLSRTASASSITLNSNRPSLNRSKSSDGHIKPRPGGALKRNRSITKAAGLFPLTKTNSNQSLKSDKSTTSLKGLASGHTSNGILPFTGLKTSTKKERAILRMNADSTGDDYEDMEDEAETPALTLEPQRFDAVDLTSHIDEVHDNNTGESRPHNEFARSSAASSSNDLTMSNNMYGGSLLLSQSTGLVRNISERPSMSNNKDPTPNSMLSFQAAGPSSKAVNRTTSTNDHHGQAPIRPNNILHRSAMRLNQMARYPKTEKAPLSDFLINDNQKVADHSHDTRTQQRLWLQRENSLMDVPNYDLGNFDMSNLSLNQMMFSHAYSSTSLAGPRSGNLAGIEPAAESTNDAERAQTKSSRANLATLHDLIMSSDDTLQQQLQSAHIGHPADTSKSMLNVTWFMLGAQSHQSSIQLRTEFERMNREYLNVRRYTNPVNESLKRTSRYFQATRGVEISKRSKNGADPSPALASKNETTFKALSELYHNDKSQVNETLNRFWQDALSDLLSSGHSTPRENSHHGAPNMRGQTQQAHSRNPSDYNGATPSRAKPAPTTRAVKLAAQISGQSRL